MKRPVSLDLSRVPVPVVFPIARSVFQPLFLAESAVLIEGRVRAALLFFPISFPGPLAGFVRAVVLILVPGDKERAAIHAG